MKKTRKIIILIIILLIFIIFSIIFCIKEINNKNINDTSNTKTVDSSEYGELFKKENADKSKEESQVRERYVEVSNCMQNYISNVNVNSSKYYGMDNNNKYTIIVEESKIYQNIYDLLSSNFIKENNITLDNIKTKVKTYKEDFMYVPYKIEELNNISNDNVESYYSYGVIQTTNDFKIKDEINAVVNLDVKNNTFSIEMLNKEEDKNKVTAISEIEKNTQNTFSDQELSYQDIAQNFMNLYKRRVLANSEWTYNNMISAEYKNNRFPELKEFNEYIEKNKNSIIGATIEKYNVYMGDGYTEYVCLTKDQKYYIFKETAPMQYTTLLDTYTVDISEVVKKYESVNDMTKGAYNIEKIITAVNDENYTYIYNKLSESFKNNKYKTKDLLVKELGKRLYKENNFKINSYSAEGDVYIYKVSITNKQKEEDKQINITIIMQIKEGTDFVMSFSFN